MEIKDIAEYEDTDSVLAQYTISDLHYRINKAIETIKDEGFVVAIKIINERNDEILLSSKDLLIDILKGEE